jgi:hypothetical protein
MGWIGKIKSLLNEDIIVIDGKTLLAYIPNSMLKNFILCLALYIL